MSHFWRLARRMLRYRLTMVGAVVFAFISAGGLGAGLVALVPILNVLLAPGGEEAAGAARATLADEVRLFNEHLAATPVISTLGVRIPEAWIEALPTGRFDAILATVIALGVLTFIGATANFMHAWLSLTVTTNTIAEIRRRAYRHALRLPIGAIMKHTSGDLVSRILQDTSMLAGGFQTIVSKALAQLTRGAAALLAAFVIDWRLSAVTLLVAPPLAIVLRKLGKRIRRSSRSAMKSYSRLLSTAGETLQSARVVKAFSREGFEVGRFSAENAVVTRELLRVRTARALATPITEMITIFVLGFLAVIAAKQIIDGHLDPSHFIMALGSLAAAAGSLKPLSGLIPDLQQAAAAATRLDEVMALPLEEARAGSRPRLARHARSIEFRDVRFTYPNADHPALDGVSLTIPHGGRVAIVGPNGSGKSTLLALLLRLLDPSGGAVLIDGVEIAGVALRSLRRQIALVPQEVVLFRGTIADNIAYGRVGAARPSAASIEEAARRAHAHDFILRQSNGYETLVGEQGLTLSGGQRQRLAIARAILRDPAILIMDEATSMIDAESESQIGEAIAEFGRERTCLVVAHRLSTVMHADLIVVMNRGRVEDQGRHEELLERSETYQQLARHQLQPMGV